LFLQTFSQTIHTDDTKQFPFFDFLFFFYFFSRNRLEHQLHFFHFYQNHIFSFFMSTYQQRKRQLETDLVDAQFPERQLAMSSTQAALYRTPNVPLNRYVEPTLLGQNILSQSSIGTFSVSSRASDIGSIWDMSASSQDLYGTDISYPDDSSLFDNILGKGSAPTTPCFVSQNLTAFYVGQNDFFDEPYTIDEYREVNRRQVLQQTVPVFQIALRATLLPLGVAEFTRVQDYLYTLFRYVCTRRGVDPLGQGYCQVRAPPLQPHVCFAKHNFFM
jgi:hypothetical protein